MHGMFQEFLNRCYVAHLNFILSRSAFFVEINGCWSSFSWFPFWKSKYEFIRNVFRENVESYQKNWKLEWPDINPDQAYPSLLTGISLSLSAKHRFQVKRIYNIFSNERKLKSIDMYFMNFRYMTSLADNQLMYSNNVYFRIPSCISVFDYSHLLIAKFLRKLFLNAIYKINVLRVGHS